MIFLILIGSFLLRLIGINQSFWLDEAIQVLESTVSFGSVWQIPADFHPPLFHYLAWFWLQFSTVEWWARLLPVLLGIGSIYFTYLFTKEMINKKVAVMACLLLSTSAFHIYYSQEFRPYMLSCFLAMASLYWFLKLLKSSQLLNVAFILANSAGWYSLYYFPFLLIGQGVVVFLFYKKRFGVWLANIGLPLLFFLPWLPMFLRQLSIGKGWAETYSIWKESVSTPLWKALPLVFAKFITGNISLENKTLYILIVSLLCCFIVVLAWQAYFKKRKETQITLIIFLTPILLAFLSSFAVPTIAPKRLLLVFPLLYLLISMGIFSLKPKFQKPVIGLFLLFNLFCLVVYWVNPRFQREQWRESVAWIEENSGCPCNSIVLFEFSDPFGPWTIYQSGKLKAKGIFEEDKEIYQAMPEIVKNNSQVFLFQYLFEMTDPEKQVEQWLLANGYRLKTTKDFSGVGFVYEYVK